MENAQEQVNQEGNLNQNLPSVNPVANQRGNFLLIIGVIVLILVIGAGGYFLYQKQTSKPTNSSQISPPTTSPTLDETANWKTYTNAKYGYSFKYPPKLTSIELSPDKGEMVVSIAGKSEGSSDEGYYTGLFNISSFIPGDTLYDSDEIAKELLALKVGDQYQPADRLIGNLTSTYPTYKRLSGMTISGVQAKVFETKSTDGGLLKKFYVSNKDTNYLIVSDFYSTQSEYYPQELYDQILSTFKFTDQDSSDSQREKALAFLKAHPNIYDPVYTVNRESFEIYRNIPEGKTLDYEWYKNHPSTTIKGADGNDVVGWSGLPGCELKQVTGKANTELYDEKGNVCYRILSIGILFDSSGMPKSVSVSDLGGVP